MSEFWNWITGLINGFAGAWTWFTTPLSSELEGALGIVTTPIVLISFSGLVAYIGYAIIRWVAI